MTDSGLICNSQPTGGKLVPRDPNGEKQITQVGDFDKLAPNNQMVIYAVVIRS